MNPETQITSPQRLLETVARHGDIGIWHTHVDYRSISINRVLAQWLELDRPEDIVGRPVAEFVAPEFLEAAQAEWEKRKRGLATRYEMVMRGLRGTRRNVLVSGAPILGSDGKPESMLGLLTDITPLKETERALRQNDDLLRRILETIPSGIVHVGLDGSIQNANGFAVQFLGLSYEEMARQYVADWRNTTVFEDGRVCPIEEMPVSRCIATGRPQGPETLGVLRPDGQLRWAIFTAAPMPDPDSGKLRGVVVTFVDITQRREAEDSLRMHAQIFERMAEGVIVLDDGGTIETANPAFEQIFGYERNELNGKHVSVLSNEPPEGAMKAVAEVADAMHTVGYWEGNFNDKRKDGTPFVSHGRVSLFRRASKTYWISVQTDVTEKQRIERELQEREELYRMLFESAPLGLGISDMQGNLLAYNDAMMGFGGYTREDIERIRNVANLYYDPADRERILGVARKDGRVDRVKVAFRHKNGHPYWTLMSLRPVKLRGQLCWQAMVEDITDRLRTEDELQRRTRSLEMLSAVAMAANQADRVEDAVRTVLREVCEATGWTLGHAFRVESGAGGPRLADTGIWHDTRPERQAGFRLASLDCEKLCASLPGLVLNAAAPLWISPLEEAPNFRRRAAARDAGLRMGVACPVRTGQEVVAVLEFFSTDQAPPDAALVDLLAVLGVQLGRTIERVGAAEQLRRQKEFSDELIRSSFDGIVAYDLDLRYTVWNPGMQRIAGVPAEAALGRIAHELFPFLEASGELAFMRGALEGREVDALDRSYEVPQANRKGYFEAHYSPLRDADGRIVGGLGTVREITERKRAEDRMRDLSKRLLDAQETERRRVARELHDGVNQILSASRMKIEALAQDASDTEAAGKDLRRASELVDQAIGEIRRISHNLGPAVLDDLGLAAAVRSACDEFRKQSGLALSLRCSRLPARMPAPVELAVFRILQEALNNVARHAQAARVNVRVAATARALTLRVSDDGRGIAKSKDGTRLRLRGGLGLDNMRERAELVGGDFEVHTQPGKGTELRVRIPITAPEPRQP